MSDEENALPMTLSKVDWQKLTDMTVDQTVLDLITRDFIIPPKSLYNMLEETEWLDKLEEEEEE